MGLKLADSVQRHAYSRPRLIKHENLKLVTAEWQCSADIDTHPHQTGVGHTSHGLGNGYGHCKVR